LLLAASTSCSDCASSSAGDRLAKSGRAGSYYSAPDCSATLAGTLPSCSKFYYTGTKQATNCSGTVKCYAQVQPTKGGASYWLFSHECGQGKDNSVAVDTNNNQCGGGGLQLPLPLPLPPPLPCSAAAAAAAVR
jgi:hypothetical protein